MDDLPEADKDDATRVFISYSRADRQRVAGLCDLLEALDHRVFMDIRSIRAGRRWLPALEKALHATDVLVVFWTRHAAKSKWVKREYNDFGTRFPDRPIVPILGDTTPLSHRLQAYQHTDFCPLINELLATVRDLQSKGVSKRKIRETVLKRLQDEGIELPEYKRRRTLYLGLFGTLGWASAPLYFLKTGSDFLADKVIGVPAAYYYTAGSAAAAGFIGCHTLFGGVDALLKPDLFQAPITVNQSGSEVCDAGGMICVSVARATVVDENEKFFGYSTPTCSARVRNVGQSSNCYRKFATEYAMTGVVIRPSLDADEGVMNLSGDDQFCISDPSSGKQGIYEFANCVKP